MSISLLIIPPISRQHIPPENFFKDMGVIILGLFKKLFWPTPKENSKEKERKDSFCYIFNSMAKIPWKQGKELTDWRLWKKLRWGKKEKNCIKSEDFS